VLAVCQSLGHLAPSYSASGSGLPARNLPGKDEKDTFPGEDGVRGAAGGVACHPKGRSEAEDGGAVDRGRPPMAACVRLAHGNRHPLAEVTIQPLR
jgi:hypothetical protein